MAKITDNFNSEVGPSNQTIDTAEALRQEIQWHERAKEGRSWLSAPVGWVYKTDDGTLEELRSLQKQYHHAKTVNDADASSTLETKIGKAIEADRSATLQHERYNDLFTGGVKLAALMTPAGAFARNRWAMPLAVNVASAAVFGLDEMKGGDSIAMNATEFCLGAAKGVGMRFALAAVNDTKWNPLTKGVALGTAARFGDAFLTADNYVQDGKFAPLNGFKTGIAEAFSPTAMLTDGVLYAGAGLASAKLRSIVSDSTSGLMLSRAVIGAGYGVPTGFVHDIERQKSAGQPVDIGAAFIHSAESGIIGAVSTVPGSLRMSLPGYKSTPALRNDARSGHNSDAEGESKEARKPLMENDQNQAYKRVHNEYHVDLEQPEVRQQIENYLKRGYKPEHLSVSMHGSVNPDPDLIEKFRD